MDKKSDKLFSLGKIPVQYKGSLVAGAGMRLLCNPNGKSEQAN